MWVDDKFVAFDLETNGSPREYALQPWRLKQGTAWITSYATFTKPLAGQLLSGVGGRIKPLINDIEAFLVYAYTNNMTVVCWNAPFDIAWLLAFKPELEFFIFRIKWLDAMLLWRHMFIEPEYDETGRNRKSYSLESAVKEFIPDAPEYKHDVTYDPQTPEEWEQLLKYNMLDAGYTYHLARKFYNALNPQQLKAALIEAASLPMVAKANLEGMVVDTLYTCDLALGLSQTAARCLATLEPDGVTEKVIRSPLQLSKVMFDDWKLPVIKTNKTSTGKISRSTDKEVLHELAFMDPRAKVLHEYRDALNDQSKFTGNMLESANYNADGRTHPEAKIFGTYTGRMTYSSNQGKNKDKVQTGFAAHQIRRDKRFRKPIVAPPGYMIMEFDAAGQEFRWMAIASGDETMLALCAPGEDAHSFMGAQVSDKTYQEVMAGVKENPDPKSFFGNIRYLGKVGNLSLQYRTSANKLRTVARVQYDIPLTPEQAKHIWLTYKQSYPGVPIYWNSQIAETKRLGYVETFAGRRVQVVGNWNDLYGWAMGSTAINYRIQGTGGDQKYLALSVIKPYMIEHGIYFGWDFHDAMYLLVPLDKVERAAVDIKALLDDLPYERAWGFKPPIPLPFDCKVGPSWGDMREIK